MTKVGVQKLTGKVAGLFTAPKDTFVSEAAHSIELDMHGVIGDHHYGLTRQSGGREPWYKRGTEMRNERHISILSVEELAGVAKTLEIDAVSPERIGTNMLIEGVPSLSKIPPRTQFFFPSGAVIRIDGYNAPCKVSGKSLQEAHDGRVDIELGFVKAAEETRGLVAWVECAGAINVNDEVKIRIWPQELYVV